MSARDSLLAAPEARLVVFAALVGAISIASPNPLLTALALGALPILMWATRRPGEPPVLLVVVAVQWVQAAIGVAQANWVGVSVNELHGFEYMAQAHTWALLGVVTLVLGIRAGLLHMRPRQAWAQRVAAEAHAMSLTRLAVVYFAMLVLSAPLALAFGGGLLRTLVGTAITMRWVVVYMIFVVALLQRRGYFLCLLVFGIEVLTGFMGYFSSFVTVFFVGGIAFVSCRERTSFRTWGAITVLALLLLGLASFWSSSKAQYREFVSRGSGMQVVRRGSGEIVTYWWSHIASTTSGDLSHGFDRLVERTGYVEYFGRVMAYVPRARPHEEGRLWGGAIAHLATPRVFNPTKAALSDSDTTRRYTGVGVAGVSEGTSIGVGYAAEAYIDFGTPGMLFPISLLGLLLGGCYRVVMLGEGWALGRSGIAIVVLMGAFKFETSAAKVLGAVLTSLILSLGLLWILLPRSSVGLRRPRWARGRDE